MTYQEYRINKIKSMSNNDAKKMIYQWAYTGLIDLSQFEELLEANKYCKVCEEEELANKQFEEWVNS